MINEYWDVLNRDSEKVGKTIKRGDVLLSGEYHLSVHIWIYDEYGNILIQKRSKAVEKYPSIWASTGGAALVNETSIEAAQREVNEELGLDKGSGNYEYVNRIVREDSIADLWKLKINNEDIMKIKLNDEVEEVKWVKIEEMSKMLKNKAFYNYGNEYLKTLKIKI